MLTITLTKETIDYQKLLAHLEKQSVRYGNDISNVVYTVWNEILIETITYHDNSSMIEFGMTVIVGLVLLTLAFVNRKESPKLALFYLAIGIDLPLLIWFLGHSIPQTGFASALLKF